MLELCFPSCCVFLSYLFIESTHPIKVVHVLSKMTMLVLVTHTEHELSNDYNCMGALVGMLIEGSQSINVITGT